MAASSPREIIIEILAVAVLTLLFTTPLWVPPRASRVTIHPHPLGFQFITITHRIVRICSGRDRGFMQTPGTESIGLMLLFIMWLVGAALATSKCTDPSWCKAHNVCRLLPAIVAFAWMSWIVFFFFNSLSIPQTTYMGTGQCKGYLPHRFMKYSD